MSTEAPQITRKMLAVLAAIADCNRFPTSGQLARVLGLSMNATMSRMRRLRTAGLIEPVYSNAGFAPWANGAIYYGLTKDGQRIISKLLEAKTTCPPKASDQATA